jgi:hypothetical protein
MWSLIHFSVIIYCGVFAKAQVDYPVVYLAINAQARTLDDGTIYSRRLEVDFFNTDEYTGIELFSENPNVVRDAQPVLTMLADQYDEGFMLTDELLTFPNSTELGYVQRCVFDWWVRLRNILTGDIISETRCLEMYPSWMSDNDDIIGDLLLSDLMLPMTHDSAAYK